MNKDLEKKFLSPPATPTLNDDVDSQDVNEDVVDYSDLSDESLCKLLKFNSIVKSVAPGAIKYFCDNSGFAEIRSISFKNNADFVTFESLPRDQIPNVKIIKTNSDTRLGRGEFEVAVGTLDSGSIKNLENLSVRYCEGLHAYQNAYRVNDSIGVGIENVIKLERKEKINTPKYDGCKYSTSLNVFKHDELKLDTSYDGNLLRMKDETGKVFFELNYLTRSDGFMTKLFMFTLAVEQDDGYVQTYNYRYTALENYFLRNDSLQSRFATQAGFAISRAFYYKTKILKYLVDESQDS